MTNIHSDMRSQGLVKFSTMSHGSTVAPTTAKLIPIVTTAATADAVTLARMYARRWPAQENIIRDYLLALGLDTNHGYAKTAVINSEVAK